MQVNLTLTPGYRLKISRASRMSELVDRTIAGLAALGGSAAFLEILRRWLQRRQEKRQAAPTRRPHLRRRYSHGHS
jgi:hypothetical protein